MSVLGGDGLGLEARKLELQIQNRIYIYYYDKMEVLYFIPQPESLYFLQQSLSSSWLKLIRKRAEPLITCFTQLSLMSNMLQLFFAGLVYCSSTQVKFFLIRCTFHRVVLRTGQEGEEPAAPPPQTLSASLGWKREFVRCRLFRILFCWHQASCFMSLVGLSDLSRGLASVKWDQEKIDTAPFRCELWGRCCPQQFAGTIQELIFCLFTFMRL